jgi:dTDP-glucose 4,6-dehydratase/UDP-glucuronate decarboxylase
VRCADDVIGELGVLNERFAAKRVLVTGAAGFLGNQFVNYFMRLNTQGVLSRPCHLLALDNFLRGVPPWLSAFRERPDFTLIAKDVTKPDSLERADFIVHAASVASPTFYRRFPIETMDANVTGLRTLLDRATADSVDSFLYFSSSEIYGDPDPGHIPTREDFVGLVSCTGPRACYDESKRYGETLCVNFWRARKVPVKIVRPFNNYGPGLRLSDGRVIPDFFRDVLAGRDLRILSDGRATRTFCFVSDALKGYLRILLSIHSGEAFNIGADAPEISMRDLADLIVRVSGRSLRVVLQKSPEADYLTDCPQRRCPDLSKALALVGYRPVVSLEEGLQRTYNYYRDHPNE